MENERMIKFRFFTYEGAKNRLAKQIIPMIPEHRLYCEAFGGSASILFRKERSPKEIYNDIKEDLFNLFYVLSDPILNRCFVSKLENLFNHQKLYEYYCLIENSLIHPIDKAVATFVSYELTRNGVKGSKYGLQVTDRAGAYKLSRIQNRINTYFERFEGVDVTCMDYQEIIKRVDKKYTFLFCDPPYLNANQRNYTNKFSLNDYEQLKSLLKSFSGKWMLTHETNTEIKDLFSNYYFTDVLTKRTNNHTRKRKEWLITNYDPSLLKNYGE